MYINLTSGRSDLSRFKIPIQIATSSILYQDGCHDVQYCDPPLMFQATSFVTPTITLQGSTVRISLYFLLLILPSNHEQFKALWACGKGLAMVFSYPSIGLAPRPTYGWTLRRLPISHFTCLFLSPFLLTHVHAVLHDITPNELAVCS
jgi:hypothetical protein